MKTWVWMAFIEWQRSFRAFGQSKGGPYKNDFVWLTVLLLLSSTLVLFHKCSNEGLLNKCMDVFLGNMPGHGIPISVNAEMSPSGGKLLINRGLMNKISRLSIDMHPYREVDIYVKLPGYQPKLWRDGKKMDTDPDFNIRAVYPWLESQKFFVA